MSRKHVLVVDDDPALRDLLQPYLKENGLEALTKLDQIAYDAVLLDCIMPEVNGLAVLRHVRDYHPSLPVMMTSERDSHASAESFVALGAWACLFKSFDRRDLEQILNLDLLSMTAGPPAL